MAAAVQRTGAVGTGIATLTKAFDSDVTSGNLIVVGWSCNVDNEGPYSTGCTKDAGSATIGTITMDSALTTAHPVGDAQAAIYSAPVTGTGSCTMKADPSASGRQILIAIAEYTNVDVTASRLSGASYGQGNTGAIASGSVTPSTANSIFVSGMLSPQTSGVAGTIDTDYTAIFIQSSVGGICPGGFGDWILTSATADTGAWTAPTTKEWMSVLANYKAVAEPAPSASIARTQTIWLQ